ncbi:MAG: metal-dependent transcriptional regulator [Acidimicrobiia bacterium]
MHDTTEEYLEHIFSLEEEGIRPMRARLVERLGISAASVSETVQRLCDQGFVELLADRSLHLTDKGRRLATSVVRRHRLAERLLVDVIGLELEKVHREADRWEHAISADVEAKLVELLGDPMTCPHGNPIPGSGHEIPTVESSSLSATAATSFTVTRMSERLEVNEDGVRQLADAQLIPGHAGTVIERNASGVRVRTTAGEVLVPPAVADELFVTAT